MFCAICMWTRKGLEYLVEEALAELVHGTLQLAALALPLLIVAHRLGRGPLPRRGSGVVVHVVESAPLVHSLLPAGGCWRGTETRWECKKLQLSTTFLLRLWRVGGSIKKLTIIALIYGGKEKETRARKGKKRLRGGYKWVIAKKGKEGKRG